jgi:NAD(P)-dependent dehydrogenase (short-subunit alcohol dehydrogenase family)
MKPARAATRSHSRRVFGYAGLAPYCASRGGVKQLTMSLADDWGPFGITVNCLARDGSRRSRTRPGCDIYAIEFP